MRMSHPFLRADDGACFGSVQQAAQNGLLDENAAANYLNVSPLTLRDWRARRKNPQPAYYKVGGRIYFKQSDLDDFIELGRVEQS